MTPAVVRRRRRRRHLLVHRLEYAVVLLFYAFFAALPWRAAVRIGAVLGHVAYWLDGPHRRVALTNLRFAFPRLSPRERARIARAAFTNLGRTAAEFTHLARMGPDGFQRWVRLDDPGAWERACAALETRGAIILTGHVGNWELLACAAGILGHPITIVHRRQHNPYVDRLLARVRAAGRVETLPKWEAARGVLRTVRARRPVAIPFDQNAGPGGVFVEFFGEPASTVSGPVRLAARTGAAIVPAFMVREPDHFHHRVLILPEVSLVATGDPQRDVLENTERLTRVLETVISQYPEQWVWMHKRWRTRPPGRPRVYA